MAPKKETKVVEETLDMAELEAESQKAQEAIKKQQADKVPAEPKRTYSEDEVRQMLQQVMKGKSSEELGDEDAPEIKRCTIPRFNNKFILAFKNMNTDEYSTTPVYAVDVFDEKIRQNIPHVTLIFDDKSELTVPLNTALDKSNKITCELIEIKEVDVSYDFGKVERQEVKGDGYTKSGTGDFVKTKVTQMLYSYVVKLPEPDGRIVEASRDVVNWKVATLK